MSLKPKIKESESSRITTRVSNHNSKKQRLLSKLGRKLKLMTTQKTKLLRRKKFLLNNSNFLIIFALISQQEYQSRLSCAYISFQNAYCFILHRNFELQYKGKTHHTERMNLTFRWTNNISQANTTKKYTITYFPYFYQTNTQKIERKYIFNFISFLIISGIIFLILLAIHLNSRLLLKWIFFHFSSSLQDQQPG